MPVLRVRAVRRPVGFETHLAAPYGAVFNAALGDLIVEDGSQLSFLRPTAPATVG